MTGLSDFQIFDPENGHVMPWLTHPALEVIKTWDLEDKNILEYGAGLSSVWWAFKCKKVMSIEANLAWFNHINNLKEEYKITNLDLIYRNCNEGDQSKLDFYTNIPPHFEPDIVVVDGILRYEAILKALTFKRPLTLIVDNWQQDFVFLCPAAEEALKDYEGHIYLQADHTDHEGKPWQTGIWHLK